MGLREVTFDISFTGNAAALVNANTAVDNLMTNTTAASSALNGLGGAIQNVSISTQAVNTALDELGANTAIDEAETSVRQLGESVSQTNRQTLSFIGTMRGFVSRSRIVTSLNEIGSSARRNISDAFTSSSNTAINAVRNIGISIRNGINSAFNETNMQGRFVIGLFNDIGRAGRTAFNATRTYINNVNASTRSLGDNLNKLSSKLNDIGGKASKLGNSLMLKVTTPIMLTGTKMIKTAASFESAMSQVKAISGANEKEFAALSKKAREMGATTQFSASQSAEALKYMAQAGWDTDKMISALPGVMNLASASGEDLALSSSIVTSSMTAFGLKADKASLFADVLAQASNASNTGVAEMGETFKYVGPLAGALKYSIEDVAIATGLMANVNVSGSQAGTALRAALSNLVKPTDQMKSAMDKLGISVTDSSGKMKPFKTVMDDMRKGFAGLTEEEKTFYAATIFGDTAMSGMLGIINASEEDYNKLGDAIYNAAGAAQKASDIMQDNLQGDFNKLKSALEEVSLQIGNLLIPHLRKGVQYVRDLVEKFGNLDETTKITILKMIGFAAAIGPLIKVFGFATTGAGRFLKVLSFLSKHNAVTMIGSLIDGFIKLKAGFIAIQGLGLKGMLLGVKGALVSFGTTILPVIATIGLLVAAGYLLYKNWDTVKAKGIEFINSLRDQFTSFLPDIMALWDNLKQIFISLLPVFSGVVGSIIGGIGSFIKTTVNLIGSVIKIFKGLTDFLLGVFTGDWKRAFDGIFNIFAGIIDAIKSIFSGVIDFFSSVLGGFLGGIKEGEKAANAAKENVAGGSVTTATIPMRTNTIPQFAKGVDNFSGGLAIVGEKGPELVDLPKGSSVKTNSETKEFFKFDDTSDEFYNKAPITKSGKSIHVIFSPTINVTTNSNEPHEIAEVSKNKIREYFEEFIDEVEFAN